MNRSNIIVADFILDLKEKKKKKKLFTKSCEKNKDFNSLY